MHDHFHTQGRQQSLYHVNLAAAVWIHASGALSVDRRCELGFSRLSSQQNASLSYDVASNEISVSFSTNSTSLPLLHITLSCAVQARMSDESQASPHRFLHHDMKS